MPNWTFNEIAIKKENKKYLINDKGEVDFNIICPMPEVLSRTISGGRIDECVLYYVWETSKTKGEFFERLETERDIIGSLYINTLKPSMTKVEIRDTILDRIGSDLRMFNDEMYKSSSENPVHTPYEVGEYYYNLYKEYGCDNWYDWSIKNWGVKWNASDTQIWEDGDLVCVSFDTPWGPPVEFLQKLSKKCVFYLEWEEEQGYHGEIMFDGEDFLDRGLPMFTWNEENDYEKEGEYVFGDMKDNVLNWYMAAQKGEEK